MKSYGEHSVLPGIRPILFCIAAMLSILLVFGRPCFAVTPPPPDSPYATLEVNRDDKSGVVTLDLYTTGRPGGDKKISRSLPKGVAAWDKFLDWYEQLFGLTYLDSDFKRLWKQLRKEGTSLGRIFFTDEMLEALKGCSLLVVVDQTFPFPADTFRFGDKWLFEIIPIVHATTPGRKDVTDTLKYSSIQVFDCQGPNDREGMEAPAVFADLQKIPGIKSNLVLTLKRDETVENLTSKPADILHLATHAYPGEFFPGRNKPGIKATELEKMKLPYKTILSTGCHTGNPVFARGVLHDNTRFLIAAILTTSGKDGVALGKIFYPSLFSGKSPFESFYAVKQRITGNKSDLPDILRFVFFVK